MRFPHFHFRPKKKFSHKESQADSNPSIGKAGDTKDYQPKTELGRRLLEIREAAIAEGIQLKSLEELEKSEEYK